MSAGRRGRSGIGYDPRSSYSVFAAYSNDSSHMILGVSENRRLIATGVDYSRRLSSRSIYSWRYQVEVIPLELLQNPKLTTTITNTPIGDPTSTDFPVGTIQYSSLQQRQCTSSSGSGTYYELGEGGQEIPVGTFTIHQRLFSSVDVWIRRESSRAEGELPAAQQSPTLCWR